MRHSNGECFHILLCKSCFATFASQISLTKFCFPNHALQLWLPNDISDPPRKRKKLTTISNTIPINRNKITISNKIKNKINNKKDDTNPLILYKIPVKTEQKEDDYTPIAFEVKYNFVLCT